MGGFGSGRPRRRSTIEGCWSLTLDVLVIMRPVVRAMRRNGTTDAFTLRPRILTWYRFGEPCAEVEYELTVWPEAGTGALRVRHGDVHGYGHPPQDYSVSLDTTRPGLGGQQWWFRCPYTGRLCRKLFLPNGQPRFACRQAYGLQYRSQGEGPADRARRRIRRISNRLGGDGSSFIGDLPGKPKWMRWPTYYRLEAQALASDDVIDADFCRQAERVLAKCR
jgi:hypothetical protein